MQPERRLKSGIRQAGPGMRLPAPVPKRKIQLLLERRHSSWLEAKFIVVLLLLVLQTKFSF